MRSHAKPVLGYILKGYPRISETFISNEILQLERQGFTIVLFPMRKPRENFTHESVKQIKAAVHYLPTDLFKNAPALLPPNILLLLRKPVRYGKALAVALRRFSRTRKIATFKHLFQAGYMVQRYLLGATPPIDHLHGHFAHSPTSVTMFASLLSGIPFSFTAHAKDIYTSNVEQLKEKIEQASFTVTCTRYNALYLREVAGDCRTPIHCVYHGIDTRLFDFRGARRTPTPPYSLFTVARLTEKKGLPTLYKALALLKEKNIPFRHTLIGDGDDRQAILRLIDELELKEQCQWLGTRTHEEVLDHFRSSDLFVLSCRIADSGDRDGIPNVLVESLAMGVPVVSTSVSAIPELIENEQTGLTVPPDDPEALAAAIEKLLTDGDLRQTVMLKGKKRVTEDFDNQSLTRKLGQIFLSETSPASPAAN